MRTFLLLAAIALAVLPQAAGDLTAVNHTDPPPAALAAGIAARLAPGGVRATANNINLTFWWVKGLPLRAGGTSAAWSDVEEGSLLGAVKIDRDLRDVRGKVIKAGAYTLRYGIQPANGDHLGVSPFRDFVLLSPVAIDKDPAPHGHDGTIDLSKEAIGGSHPAVWSIDPPVTTENLLGVHTNDLGLKAVIVELPATRDGNAAGALRFGLVLIGRIEA
jgi:hypothetical protein